MISFLKTVFLWFVTSSADPEKLSRTLIAGIPTIMVFVGWANLSDQITPELIQQGILLTVTAVVLTVKAVGAVTTAFFFLVKIVITIKDKLGY